MTKYQWMSITAVVILGAVFLWQLASPTSNLVTGLAGLAAGVAVGTAFPGRRGIVRTTR